MIVQPDDLIKQVLTSSLTALRVDQEPLKFIFQQKTPTELAEIIEFFGSNKVAVRLAYPRAAADLPGLYINISAGSEVDQVIGSDFPMQNVDVDPDFVAVTGIVGTWIQETVTIGCMSTNADLTAWLSNIAMWAIIGSRLSLNAAGFIEQRIGLRDLAPESRLAPDMVFRRDLSVTGKVPATAEDFVEYAQVNSIRIFPTVVPFIGSTTVSGIGDD